MLLIILSFAAGFKYSQSKKIIAPNFMTNAINNRAWQNNGAQPNGNRLTGKQANVANGEIISIDDVSLTIKLREGGSKIVFYSASSTPVVQSVIKSPEDLKIGENVLINGKNNTDGSIVAQSIQIQAATSSLIK